MLFTKIHVVNKVDVDTMFLLILIKVDCNRDL